MIIYLIKATFCALFFLFIYVVLFEKEKMHRFKRHYLLCSLVFSFAIPLVALNIAVPQLNKDINRLYSEIYMIEKVPEQIVFPTENYVEDFTPVTWSVDYVFMTKALYMIVVLVLLFRLFRNMYRLLYCVKNSQILTCRGKKIALIKDNLAPYSFINHIFINEEDYKNGLIAEEMIGHELAHIEQKHSLDIIFIELLIALCWFNPVLYLYRKKIKQNHEFLADEAVLKADNNVTRYQNILIGIISKNGSTGLASSLNYSTIKKRFIMMKKETSQRTARYKKVLLAPALLFAICMFSTRTNADEPTATLTEPFERNKPVIEDIVAPIDENSIAGISHFDLDENMNRVENLPETEMPEPGTTKDPGISKEAAIHGLSKSMSETVMENAEDTVVYTTVDKMPIFPGGDAALLKWIEEHLIYPEATLENRIQGRVSCTFVVNTDGSVSDIKVVRPLDANMDEEAVRVISTLPKFTPGEMKGKPVRVRYAIPVRFMLPSD